MPHRARSPGSSGVPSLGGGVVSIIDAQAFLIRARPGEERCAHGPEPPQAEPQSYRLTNGQRQAEPHDRLSKPLTTASFWDCQPGWIPKSAYDRPHLTVVGRRSAVEASRRWTRIRTPSKVGGAKS